MTESERSRDVDRVLTCVDAIVAIAVTLLVLSLVEVTRALIPHDYVGNDRSAFEAVAISFVIVTLYWLAQHRVVRHVIPERRSVVLILLIGLGIMLSLRVVGYYPLVLLLLSDRLAEVWRRLRGRSPRDR